MKTNNSYTPQGNTRSLLRLVKATTRTATCTAALLLAAACSNELPQEGNPTDNGNPSQGTPITLTASIPTGGGADTRISFEDKYGEGVKLSWTQGDAFKLFTNTIEEASVPGEPSPIEAGLFTLAAIGADSQQATFSGMLTAQPANASNGYTAYYPASKFIVDEGGKNAIALTGQVQDGNNTITHLADYNLMIATGITDLTKPITFTPMMTMLTFKLTMPDGMQGTPIELKLKTDENVFKEKMFHLDAYSNEFRLGLKNITLSSDKLLTAHMLVYCDDLTGKELSTIVSTSTGEVYTYTATVTKKYEKGKRYTATVASEGWTETTSPGIFDDKVAADEGTEPKTKTGDSQGTEGNPCLIASAANLRYLVKNPGSTTDNYYKLTTDIFVTTDKWTPIGNNDYNFQGKGFDGNGHTINGVLKMSETSESNTFFCGFFGYAKASDKGEQTIKNLTVNADVEVSALKYTGSSGYAYIYVGGIAGRISYNKTYYCSIENCSFNGKMTVTDINIGEALPSSFVGGIVGCSAGGGTYANLISDCTNTGTINSPTINNTNGELYIGGILGSIASDGIELHTCLNAGTVNITDQFLREKIHYGGLSGDSFYNTNNIIYNCCNHTGTINVKGTQESPGQWTNDGPSWTPTKCTSHTKR